MPMVVLSDLEALSRRAVEVFTREAERAILARGRFLACLCGGTTPPRTYQLLGQTPLPWERIHLFWGDERCQGEPDNHLTTTRDLWFTPAGVPAQNLHPLRTLEMEPQAAADDYQAHLEAFFAGQPPDFDLAFLGLGADGHTASLFPGSPALQERKRWVTAHYVPAKGRWRVTLTYPALQAVRQRVFLVSGAGKAATLAALLRGETFPATPLAEGALFLVDQAAASLTEGRAL